MNTKCYHCGDDCAEIIEYDNKPFCCEGCKQVFLLLNEHNLCGYYNLDKTPGLKAKGKFISGRFAYLNDAEAIDQLVQFSSEKQVNVTFSIPQMHCSSCIFLLENLHRVEPGIIKSTVSFRQKEAFIIFDPTLISLRKVVELLAFIGYEPYISLGDAGKKKTSSFNRKRIYRIGVAGFCFANIMMLSFPEYFSAGNIEQPGLKQTFSLLSFVLSLPVLFFSASVFFISAWKGLRQKYLNIDAPIALAILVTFIRSYYEILSGTGAGYLDSGSGIVFFMLIGRWFQDKTYDALSFDRDYKAYFPLGVSRIENGLEKNIPVTQLKKGDLIIVRNEEMIPADSILVTGNAAIDYSFVTGESVPVTKEEGELIYAGGKQCGGAIEMVTTGTASQGYITRLWNNNAFTEKHKAQSFIHPWSRYFTLALFSVAAVALVYWWMTDTAKLLPAVTAVLIVACPCSLLLSATFTFGNMVRIFGKNKLYLKNAAVIESLAGIDTVVFDKTGTLTVPHASVVRFEGSGLDARELAAIKEVAKQSAHPLSKTLSAWFENKTNMPVKTTAFKEYAGMGAEAMVDEIPVRIGSTKFIHPGKEVQLHDTGTGIYVSIGNNDKGCFRIENTYRKGIAGLAKQLQLKKYELHVLSGDNDAEKENLQQLFGPGTQIHFNQSPQDKLDYIKALQQQNKKVLMLGDGLNDAGALMQSNTGIAISDQSARFTPACDAILDGEQVTTLHRFLSFARSGKKIVTASFILSIIYNIAGLSFAVQGILSPMIAAILMPASSISIVLLAMLNSGFSARKNGL